MDSPTTSWTLTGGQLGFFFGYTIIVLLWAYSCWLKKTVKATTSPRVSDEEIIIETAQPTTEEISPEEVQLISMNNPVSKVLSLNKTTLLEHSMALQWMAEFGGHLLFYFLCDRTSIMKSGEKNYSRDVFWFIYILLVAYNLVMCVKEGKAPSYLNRDQTEEWKGWMQVLFLMYHYFEAKEQYSSIRLYIAAYVWMTGFGNFSFYYIRKDFSFTRFVQMLWRLNFLVFWVCIVLGNSYMLYYICPMHTIWTIAVYLVLLVGNNFNTDNTVILLKITLSFVMVFGLFFSQDFFYSMWKPLTAIVGYVNPANPSVHPMHEWFFRAGLDRYVWIVGMICANFHPKTESTLIWIDNLPTTSKVTIRFGIVAFLLSVGYYWYISVFILPKREYNALHPYTSWIPIIIFIILRNLTPWLRMRSLTLFSWLGKITLETYIGQFHIWLHTGIPDAQPKALMTVVSGYPVCYLCYYCVSEIIFFLQKKKKKKKQLLNFMATTPVYIYVSYRLFMLTNELKFHLLPSGSQRNLYRNLLLVTLTWTACYTVGLCLRMFLDYQNQSTGG